MPDISSSNRLTPASPSSASATLHHVLNELREAIVTARLRPGDRLVEAELANELGVSRYPVREALHILSRENLTTIRSNRGAVVSSVSEDDILEVYMLKNLLCTTVLERLINDDMATRDLVESLKTMVAEYREESKRSPSIHSELDRGLQVAIVEAAGLPRVSKMFTELSREMRRFFHVLDVQYPHAEQMWDKLEELVTVIGKKDLEQANIVWSEINQRSIEEYRQALSDRAQWTA